MFHWCSRSHGNFSTRSHSLQGLFVRNLAHEGTFRESNQQRHEHLMESGTHSPPKHTYASKGCFVPTEAKYFSRHGVVPSCGRNVRI
jgi:hypothetical protein